MMKLLVISLLFSLASTEEEKVTCTAPTMPLEKGENISITFHFPFDVSLEKSMSVDVYLQPKNGDRETIALCMRLNTETLDCTAEKGYSIEGEVKTSLKLHIMNISDKHNGLVFCQVMPQYGDLPDAERCSLSVHGMSDGSNTTETTTFADVDGGSGDDESYIGLYVGVGVGMLVVVIIIIIVVFCRWYRKRDSNHRPQDANSRDGGEVEELMPPMENVQQDGGEVEELMPPMENVQQDDADVVELMHPMENVQQDGGEVEELMPPMENVQQDDGEVEEHTPPKLTVEEDDGEEGTSMVSKRNDPQDDAEAIPLLTVSGDGGEEATPMVSTRNDPGRVGELENLMPSKENVQQDDGEEGILPLSPGHVKQDDGEMQPTLPEENVQQDDGEEETSMVSTGNDQQDDGEVGTSMVSKRKDQQRRNRDLRRQRKSIKELQQNFKGNTDQKKQFFEEL